MVKDYIRNGILGSIFAAMLISLSANALDNPDAKNLIKQFESEAQPYKEKIRDEATTSQEYIDAYREYERFLDDKLNQTYKALIANLDKKQKEELRATQRSWLAYRNNEFEFIGNNWTRSNFGSSSIISRGDYRTKIVENRVRVLLHYLQNYQ